MSDIEVLPDPAGARDSRNKLRPEDRAVHDWYRFVLSFPPHLIQEYVDRFGAGPSDLVLDPFCGTGTTLVECKKLGIGSVGIESTPMAHFAGSAKVDWSVDCSRLVDYADTVSRSVRKTLEQQGIDEWEGTLFAAKEARRSPLLELPPERSTLLLKDSISALPLHKTLVLLDAIDRHGSHQVQQYGRLALATALVHRIGNLKFGPEVGVGPVKKDAPVAEAWLGCMRTIIQDLRQVRDRTEVPAQVIKADSREAGRLLGPQSVDAVITSPPYPNEKDYTRTTRLESVILGHIRDKQELRSLKQSLIRSNTRGVYKSDTDDREIASNVKIREIADAIERRRVELGKTSGFERMYPRVTRLYFGGMVRHLASLRTVLRPGAKLAYVVGDQASYLRVMIRTGQLLADLAESLNYRVIGIDLFRTRLSTVTGDHLREEVVLLEWPGSRTAMQRSSRRSSMPSMSADGARNSKRGSAPAPPPLAGVGWFPYSTQDGLHMLTA